jgi:F-type H+-transporting ATPase subunit gamma
MASLKEVRIRIGSVNSTKQITSAMKMVSAAKLRRAQDAITRMRPYSEKLTGILGNVSASLDASESKFGVQREVKRVLLVSISSNRGLAGAFNSQVNRSVKRLIAEYAGAEVKVLAIGKKASDAWRRTSWHAADLPDNLAGVYDGLSFDKAAPIAQAIMDRFASGAYDKVILVYNRFKNAGTQVLTEEPFLPVLPKALQEEVQRTKADHIMEPDRATIVQEIVPKSLKIQLYKALLDSHAAEHGARMTAMHKATDNADSLLKDLKLSYNKARQAAITGEILEIVGGAEALKG